MSLRKKISEFVRNPLIKWVVSLSVSTFLGFFFKKSILTYYSRLSLLTIQHTFILAVGGVLIFLLSGVQGWIEEVNEGINTLVKLQKEARSGNPKNSLPEEEEKEEEAETSGLGALGGMIVGGGIGLIGGPVGVVIGGILGAVIGDEIEREQEEKRKEKEE